MQGLVKKHLIAPFLNAGTAENPNWTRIKKSTAFSLSMNPDVQEYDYISDESPTKELDKYSPSFNNALTMYKGEPDYEFVFNKFFHLSTGTDAETEILLVFFQEEMEAGKFKAWKSKCTIAVQELNSVDKTLTFDVNFGGTVAKGYVTVDETTKQPTFTETSGQVATPTATPPSGEVDSGDTVALACATSGATIHYTTDGSTPTASSTEYSSAISITADTTIKAIALKDGMEPSDIAVFAYTVG